MGRGFTSCGKKKLRGLGLLRASASSFCLTLFFSLPTWTAKYVMLDGELYGVSWVNFFWGGSFCQEEKASHWERVINSPGSLQVHPFFCARVSVPVPPWQGHEEGCAIQPNPHRRQPELSMAPRSPRVNTCLFAACLCLWRG